MASIERPGVTVTQETVTTTPTIVNPDLAACLIGPCVQIVAAFDDDGDTNPDALAGSYQDGAGVVAYDFPGIKDSADPSPYEDDIRVFLVTGTTWTELNGESDEEDIASGTGDGTYTSSTRVFTAASGTFVSDGVEAGDAIRLTYAGRVYDLIVDTVDSDTQLTAEADLIGEDLVSENWEIIRNPAQFVYKSAEEQASVAIITDEDNYITFSTVDGGDYDGADGDTLDLVIEESDKAVTGADGAVGDSCFTSAGASFTSTIGAAGAITGHKIQIGAAGSGQALRDILYVIDDTRMVIESGEGEGLSTQTYIAGNEITPAAATGGTYDESGGANPRELTVPGADFLASIPNGGVGTAPSTDTYVQMTKTSGPGLDGVYQVAIVRSNEIIELDAGATPTNDMAGVSIELVQADASGADGATGALTDVWSPSGAFTTAALPGTITTYAVVVDGTDGQAVAARTDDYALTLSSGLSASGADESYQVSLHTQSLVLALDTDNNEVTIQLPRGADGVSTITYAALETAITSALDPAYDADVAAAITAVDTGTGNVTADDVGTYDFDGGVDADQLLLDEDLLGSTTPTGQIYVSYKALRLDVSAEAADPKLLSYESTTEAEAAIGPITDPNNPLGLGFWFALANSPTNPVKGIGVASPDSTDSDWETAWSAALDFLLGEDVYTLVPLTQDPVIHALVEAHVDAASLPANKAERIALVNQDMPLYSKADVIASGTEGNTGDVSVTEEFATSFDFSLLTTAPAADDILVVTSKAASDESPSAVNGTVGPKYGVKIDGVKSGDNFVLELDATDVAAIPGTEWDSLVDVAWTLYRPGSAITAASDQATAVAAVGDGFENKRIFHVWPDTVTASLGGTEQNIDGVYLAAAWAGKIGASKPQQPMTNLTVAGFTDLKNSNGYFSESQLNEIAGGGTFICIQESDNAPLKCRHQLSTLTDTINNREMSITKAVDFVAKFLRTSLSPQIGSFNITQQYLDTLTVIVQSLLRYCADIGVVRTARLITLEQDDTNPDTLNITVLAEVLYPANYIAITLQF